MIKKRERDNILPNYGRMIGQSVSSGMRKGESSAVQPSILHHPLVLRVHNSTFSFSELSGDRSCLMGGISSRNHERVPPIQNA